MNKDYMTTEKTYIDIFCI